MGQTITETLKRIIGISTLIMCLSLGFCADRSAEPQTTAPTTHKTVKQSTSEKVKGVSFVAPVGKIEASAYDAVVDVKANWVCLMPYGYSDGSPKVYYNVNRQWWGERKEGTVSTIKMAKEKGFKVMVKPQLWLFGGNYTGHYQFSTEEEWQQWEKSYAQYILDFAKISDSMRVEMFCIGTEWEKFVAARPDFWNRLIKDVRKIYQGKITYAANWDEYKRIPFWKELDFIGVDAYFPLVNKKVADVGELKTAWEPHLAAMKSIAEANDRPILLTEYGFRSRDFSTHHPWEMDRGGVPNQEAQSNAYQAFFAAVWEKEWIAGGFVWKWFDYHDRAGGVGNTGFTPQNKAAEAILKEHYSQP